MNSGIRRHRIAQAGLAGVALIALSGAAEAQQQVAQDTGRLEEIVVTARRQAEAAQSTPVSLSAFNENMLDNFNIKTVEKLGAYVPNITVSPTTSYLGAAPPFIRGIGSQEPQMAVDSPTGIYLDGVSMARGTAVNTDLLDVERIEVLRGPQGTLFGRNTTGGAVSLITKTPPREFGIEEKAGYGSFNQWYSRTSVNTGEILPGVTANLSYLHKATDGWVDNPNQPDSHDPGARRADAVWFKVHGNWDKFTADYSFDFDHTHGQTAAPQLRMVRPDVLAFFSRSPSLGGSAFVYDYARLGTYPLAARPDSEFDIYGHTLTLQYDINDALAVKSITGERRYWSSMSSMYAAPGLLGVTTTGVQPIVLADVAHRDAAQTQLSEEVQLLGKSDRFTYVGGFYYFHEKAFEFTPTSVTVVTGGGALGINALSTTRYYTKNDSYAGFGHLGYRPPILDDKLEITGGVRYSIDHKRVIQQAPAVRNGDKKFYNTSYAFSANYNFTDDVMGYARISTGFRSGGYNIRAGAGVAFEYAPEKAHSYEVGLKSEWLDHKLRVNAALYHTDYDNLQVSQFTGATVAAGSGFTSNANAKFDGGELEINALLMPGLTFDGSIGLTIPVYKAIYFPDPVTNVLTNYAKDAHFGYVARWTNHAGLQYSFPETMAGILSVRADYVYQSQRWWHAVNLSTVNPFNDNIKDEGEQLVSARISLTKIPLKGLQNLEISVWGENLLNEVYAISGIDFGTQGYAVSTFGQPRSFGVDFKVKF